MKYRIISVGKIREKFYLEGVREYLKRLSPYGSFELTDGLEEKVSSHPSQLEITRVLDKEGERVLHLLGDREMLVILDLEGEAVSSEELAVCLRERHESGLGRINFVIGASHGLAPAVKRRADRSISFSRMTFPHQMAVLILCEQIYRSFKILKGEPYHK